MFSTLLSHRTISLGDPLVVQSTSVHGRRPPFALRLRRVPCMEEPCLLYQVPYRRALGCFQSSAVTNNAALDPHKQDSFSHVSGTGVRSASRRELGGSEGICVCNFSSYCQIAFRGDCCSARPAVMQERADFLTAPPAQKENLASRHSDG